MDSTFQTGDVHLTPKALAFRYKDMFMAANVVGYNYIGGMMLPLSFTAGLTGSYIEIDYQNGRAEGWIEDPQNTFVMDLAKRKVTMGGQERVLPQGVVSLVGKEIYVDASYLASILPLNYQVNYETNIIELQPQKDLRVFQRMDFMNRYFENIRKQAGLPYRPWTLEEAIAASSPQEPAIQQPALPADMPADRLMAVPALVPQTGAVPASPYGTPGVSQTAPVGAVTSGDAPAVLTTEGGQPESGTAPYAWGDDTPVAMAGDEKTGSLRLAGENIVLDTQSASGELQAQPNPVLDENRLLILQPELSRIKGDYIEAYEHGSGYYLPLGYLMNMLELGIGVNPATMEASGFFISEDNTFYLNGKTNEAIIRGEKITFPPGLVVANQFELYVDAQLLAKLLPIDFRLSMSNLTLSILPREKLPVQAGIERNSKWATVSMWKQFDSDPYRNAPVVKTPYKLATVPSADVQLGSFYRSHTGQTNSRASVLATGDVGYLDTEAFALVDTNENQTVSTLRVKAGRSDRDGNLLGPLKAKEVYAGDVQSYPMPLVANSELGRGFKISNRELRRPDQFDNTDFYGDAQPGWEVELYQNSVLIDFQIVGNDGRYAFTNVPINYGDNTFRIVQYGPQGQKQEEVREFNIDDQMPAKGTMQYAVSANEFRKGLIALDDNIGQAYSAAGPAVVGMAEYGVNDKLSVGAGLAHVPVQDVTGNVGEYNFASANLRTSLLGVNTNFNTAYDVDNGGWAAGVTGLTRIGLTTLRGEQRFYNDFESAEQLRSFLRPLTVDEILAGYSSLGIQSRMETRTDLTASRPVTLPGLGNLSALGNFLLETFEEGESDTSVSGRFSKNFRGSNIAGSMRYRNIDRGALAGGDYVDGGLNIRHNFSDDLLFRAGARYQFLPDLELSAINMSLQKQWNDEINTRLEYTESLLSNGGRRVSGYLNWDFDTFFLSPRVEFNEDFDYLVGLSLQFSLGMDARTKEWNMTSTRIANSGVVSARAFLDENADGVMNEGEQPIEGAVLNNNYTTDAQGIARIPNVSAFQPTRVVMNKASVAGSGATPKEDAYAVVARPGVTSQLDYPVVPTLEIEGIAYLQENGDEVEYPGLLLELVNKDGEAVREVRTEFDGYYYLADVYPGQYTLRVADKEVKAKQLTANNYAIDTTKLRDEGKFEGYVTGYDFRVQRTQLQEDVPVAIAAVERSDGADEQQVLTAVEQAVPVEPVQTAEAEVIAPVVKEALPSPLALVIPPVTVQEEPQPAVAFAAAPEPQSQERRVFVQAGMYCDYKNAQRQVDTLTVAGFNAALKGRSYKGQSCYLVHVGPAQDLAAAELVTRRLQDMGMDKPIIVEENAQVYE